MDSKRCRETDPSRTEMPPKLIPDVNGRVSDALVYACMTPIFKFLPTYELIRFISKMEKPLLGNYWSLAQSQVMEQRLPLSLGVNTPFVERTFGFEAAVFDRLGAKVSVITKPELFCDSAICGLIERASFLYRFRRSKHQKSSTLRLARGKELLLPLSNLTDLQLSFGKGINKKNAKPEMLFHRYRMRNELQRLLPQLQSFAMDACQLSLAADGCDIDIVAIIRQMTSLRELTVSVDTFSGIMPAVVPFVHRYSEFYLHTDAINILPGLEVLRFAGMMNYEFSRPLLHLVQSNCRNLRELSVAVYGELNYYFAMLRELPRLRVLGLHCQMSPLGEMMWQMGYRYQEQVPTQPMVCGDEAPIISNVTDLSISCNAASQGNEILTILSKFPNVSSLEINAWEAQAIIQLTSRMRLTQIFPALERVSFYMLHGAVAMPHIGQVECPSELVLQFIRDPFMPRVVDLTKSRFLYLAKEADFLINLYRAMESNAICQLSMRGPVHSEALAQLQDLVISEAEFGGRGVKIISRKNKFLAAQPGIHGEVLPLSDFTDFKITGTKTCGSRKGDQFVVRICHQLS